MHFLVEFRVRKKRSNLLESCDLKYNCNESHLKSSFFFKCGYKAKIEIISRTKKLISFTEQCSVGLWRNLVMGISERKERDRLEMKKLILDTATEMFLEQGFEKTSIRNIAERIEYSPATIYLYFKDKTELFFAIQEVGFSKLMRYFEVIHQFSHPIEKLRAMADAYLKFALENPAFYDLMFIMTAPMDQVKRDDDKWACGETAYQVLVDVLSECVSQKLIRFNDPNVASLAMWSFVHGIASLQIRQRMMMFTPEEQHFLIQGSINSMLEFCKTETTSA